MTNQIKLVDDEEIVRLAYQRTLRQNGCEVETFGDARKALQGLSKAWSGVLVSDIMMPEMDGMELLKAVREIDPDLPVILITGKGDIPMAVEAMREGAYDFLEKPFATETFLDVIRRALEKRRLILEVRNLRSRLNVNGVSELIGKTPEMERLRKIISSVADSEADILLEGETGSGKDMVARRLHEESCRAGKHFVALNCGAMPETIIESELFGHEAGSFTGANKRRIGKFEYADGGTVFLDEIESMPLHLQVKLLRVLQERTVERIGSNTPVPINIRVIAATKIDLKEAGDRDEFRQDLYYRLNVVKITLPPLRKRPDDIPLLFRFFVAEACSKYKKDTPPVPSRQMIQSLMSRSWKGNVRELKNEAEKFVLGLGPEDQETLGSKDTSMELSNEASLNDQVAAFEKNLIAQELTRQKGSLKKTHLALGVPRQTLCSKMARYKMSRKDYV